jgi:hypothetical protein
MVLSLLLLTTTGCGGGGEQEEGIGWTKFSNMEVLPDLEVESPWTSGGGFLTKEVSRGILIFETEGKGLGFFEHPDDSLNNGIGTTAEIKMKFLKCPGKMDYHDAAIFGIQDGTKEGKLAFLSDMIAIYDMNKQRETYPIDTSAFHTYRICILGDTMDIYVDGKLATSTTLSERVSGKKVFFGDYHPEEGENIKAQIKYVGYSTSGAFSP